MWSNRLTLKEVQRTERAIADLSTVPWAQPLLARLDLAGGIQASNMPLMFEVRYAQELHHAGMTAKYEFPAGIGNSTIEFRLNTSPPWLIELVSIQTSDAAKRAIQKVGPIHEQRFRPTPGDPGRSVEGEMITAQQKIVEKAFTKGKPTKFPPVKGALHLILIDMRGYLDQGHVKLESVILDYRQIAYGRWGIPARFSEHALYWVGEPIKGLFEYDNPLRGARQIQERIHFLGFLKEHAFHEGEIKEIGYYCANWHLFSDGEERRLYETYPLVLRPQE